MIAGRFKRAERRQGLATEAWLRAILIVLALALSILSGRMVTTSSMSPLLIVAAIAVPLAVVLRPHLVLWLVPVGVAIPRTVPRLFGQLGPLELTLALGVMALLMYRSVYHQRFYMDWFFKLMLLTALPIGLSWLAGRGELDDVRLYIWSGSCLAYLLAINLATGKRDPYQVLGATAMIVVGLLIVDVWLKGAVRPSSVEVAGAAWKTYRHTATTVGQSQFASVLMAMVLPVLLAYGLTVKNRPVRGVSLLLFVGGTTLAISLLTRAFVVSLIVSALAMSYVLVRKQGTRSGKVALGMVLLVLFPAIIMQIQAPVINSLLIGQFVQIYEENPRVEIWLGLLKRAVASPLWGYGATNPLLRFGIHGGHGLFPQMLFEYGLSLVVPLIMLLAKWFTSSWQLVRRDDLDNCQLAFALASWGIVTAVLIGAILNDYLYTHGAYPILAFFTAGLLTAQLRLLNGRT